MRADVVEHADILDRRRERVAWNALPEGATALVRHPLQIDRPRHVLVGRHVVFDCDGKIDNARHDPPEAIVCPRPPISSPVCTGADRSKRFTLCCRLHSICRTSFQR